MKNICYYFFIALLCMPLLASAQNAKASVDSLSSTSTVEASLPSMQVEELFSQGNARYAEGNYGEAILLYEQLLAERPSAQLYYNLGNAYFKTGEVAQSILAYERALRLKPNYTEAKFNLAFAEAKIVDNIEDNTRFFLVEWAIALRNMLSEQVWFVLSIILFLCCLVGVFLFAFLRPIIIRKTAFHTAWIALLFSAISLWCALAIHHRDTAREEAIIMQGIVNAKSSPDKSGTDLFVLHEGTKVRITDTLSDWVEIHVGSYVGWIHITALERI